MSWSAVFTLIGLSSDSKNGFVAREHAHAGADGRLRHICWRDVSGLKLGDRRWQFAFQGADELSASNDLGGGFLLPANENDRVGESIGALRRSCRLGAHRPSAEDSKARRNDGLQKGCPAS
jgi:hypothetical protein